MRKLKDVIKELRETHGNKAQVAEKIGISSQLLGQYESGRHEPKIEFFEKWIEVYGEDIRKAQKGLPYETNVSHGTQNHTHDENEPALTENPLGDLEVYRTIVEGKTEYLLIPRSVLQEKYRIQSIEDMEKDRAVLDALIEFNRELLRRTEPMPVKQGSVQPPKVEEG